MTGPPTPAARRPAPTVLAVVSAVLLTACATPAEPAAVASAASSALPSHPVATAGGACYLLGHPVIRDHLGLDLDVAAARSRGDTHACVMRAEADPVPELVLTVTPATVDVPTFVEDITPPGATAVSELGKAGYHGPGLEVGWLSGDDRLLMLTLTLPTGADPDRYSAGLLQLARAVDRARN